jgi:hypothetical protein
MTTNPTQEQLIAEARKFASELDAYQDTYQHEAALVSDLADALTAALQRNRRCVRKRMLVKRKLTAAIQERDEAIANVALWPALYQKPQGENDTLKQRIQELETAPQKTRDLAWVACPACGCKYVSASLIDGLPKS